MYNFFFQVQGVPGNTLNITWRRHCVEVAHTAWNILQTVHKGTTAVKINKLQQLTTRFKSIRCWEVMQNGAALGSTPKTSIAHDQPVKLKFMIRLLKLI